MDHAPSLLLHSLNTLMLKTAGLSIIMGTVRGVKMSKPWLLYSHYSPGHLVSFSIVEKSSGQHSTCHKRGKLKYYRHSWKVETTCSLSHQGRVYEGVGIWHYGRGQCGLEIGCLLPLLISSSSPLLNGNGPDLHSSDPCHLRHSTWHMMAHSDTAHLSQRYLGTWSQTLRHV